MLKKKKIKENAKKCKIVKPDKKNKELNKLHFCKLMFGIGFITLY